jgi:hypothetical protein
MSEKFLPEGILEKNLKRMQKNHKTRKQGFYCAADQAKPRPGLKTEKTGFSGVDLTVSSLPLTLPRRKYL